MSASTPENERDALLSPEDSTTLETTTLDPAQGAGDREEPTRLNNVRSLSARFFYGKEISVEDSALPFLVLGLPVPPRDQPVQIAKVYHHLHLRETAMLRRHQEEITTANARILRLEKQVDELLKRREMWESRL